jgi:LPS export ABC transporter protein LptC
MNRIITYSLYLVTALAVTLLFSACKGKGEEIRKDRIKADGPISEGTDINLKYTDSGRVTTHLIAASMRNFENAAFPYQEFPDGVEVTFTDNEGKESIITSDYAIRYKNTNLIDLQKNVTLLTSDSVTLNASQLYWDKTIGSLQINPTVL